MSNLIKVIIIVVETRLYSFLIAVDILAWLAGIGMWFIHIPLLIIICGLAIIKMFDISI